MPGFQGSMGGSEKRDLYTCTHLHTFHCQLACSSQRIPPHTHNTPNCQHSGFRGSGFKMKSMYGNKQLQPNKI